ncbi:MAG: monovalent cation:proton antiporter-2 (CPA2) family protein [Agarilytica sp.]
MEISLNSVAIPYLVEIVAFLLGVVIIVPLFKKIRISPILGFLAIGTLIGPHTLGVVKDIHGVQHFAELGVIFLLFTIGLELSFERLKAYSGLIFGFGSAQVITCSLAIGAMAYLWGNGPQAAIIIGLCLSLSSTAMVIQLLNERGETASPHGRASFSVLLFQDLAVVPILILLTIFGKEEESSIIGDIFFALVNACIAIGFIVLLGRFGLRKFFEIAAQTKSIDVFTAMTLLTILAISMVTGLAGLSMALGAFLAGLLLAETEFRHQIEGEIAPFKGLFLGLFFMSVGMNIDFAVAFERGLWVIASVIGLISVKAAMTFACARLFKIRMDHAIRTSILLSESGEFAFVVIGQATLTYNIVSHEVGQFMIVVAGFSMMLTPLLAVIGHALGGLFKDDKGLTTDAIDDNEIHDHIVIAGYGRVGKTVANVLKEEAIPYLAIDNEPEKVRDERQINSSVFVGDATRSEVLKHTGIERASALLITMNSAEDALKTLHVARQHWPDLTIIVRAHDTTHSHALMEHGASQVVPETLEASLQLSNYVLRATGFSRDEANNCIDSVRELESIAPVLSRNS